MSTSVYRMFQRRGTKSQWETTNPVLAVGEIGFSFNENVIKIGDGATAWNSLESLDGKSAYELAVAGGYSGTQTQWLASLAGDALPTQTGQNGKFLTTNGTSASWATVDLSSKQNVVSGVSDTEIGYLDGVTSSIQTQINAKANSSSPTITNPTIVATEPLTRVVDGLKVWDAPTNLFRLVFYSNQSTLFAVGSVFSMAATGVSSLNGMSITVTAIDTGLTINDGFYSYWFLTLSPTNSADNAAFNAWKDSSPADLNSITLTITTPRQISTSELSYLDGITSRVQTQIDTKAPIASPTFTGTVTGNPAAPANADTAKAIGFIGLPQTILNSGGLTLSAAHAGDHIYVTGSSQTITIPANSSVPLEIGTTIVVINGNVTSSIAITSDTLRLAGTATTGTRTLATYGMATLVKVDATTWIASGNGLT